MGYFVKVHSNKTTFSIIYEWYVGNKQNRRFIPKAEWPELGVSPNLSIEEAKSILKSLSLSERGKKTEEKRERAKARVEAEDKKEVLYVPKTLDDAFVKEVLEGSRDSRRKKTCWRAAKRAIKAVELPPESYKFHKTKFYRYFVERHWSPHYVRKITQVLTLWTEFLTHKTGKAYLPLPLPKGRDREEIADSYYDNRVAQIESDPLTPELLEKCKDMPEAQYRWLYVSVWLGLRPEEVDGLNSPRLEYMEGVQVIAIYQSKLKGIPRDQRWKYIPLLFPEQLQAIEYIKKGLKRPLVKTIKRYTGKPIGCYGGRKGFQDLMLSKGRKFHEIQAWLGHQTIDQQWTAYRNRRKVLIEK